jgi:hypothetical protein
MFDGINPNLRILPSRVEQARISVAHAAPEAEDARERMEIRHTSFLLKKALLVSNTRKCGSGIERLTRTFF